LFRVGSRLARPAGTAPGRGRPHPPTGGGAPPPADPDAPCLIRQESISGRFEPNGSFRGTRWLSVAEDPGGERAELGRRRGPQDGGGRADPSRSMIQQKATAHHGDTENHGGCTDRVIRGLNPCPPYRASPGHSWVNSTPIESAIQDTNTPKTSNFAGVLLTKHCVSDLGYDGHESRFRITRSVQPPPLSVSPW
jgi:hypothetical protein